MSGPTKAKPCPFCGGSKIVYELTVPSNICCETCNAAIYITGEEEDEVWKIVAKTKLTEKWNNRTAGE